jgi:hypothetical protein
MQLSNHKGGQATHPQPPRTHLKPTATHLALGVTDKQQGFTFAQLLPLAPQPQEGHYFEQKTAAAANGCVCHDSAPFCFTPLSAAEAYST